MDYLKTIILSKSAVLDRTNEQEVQEFNKLLTKYKQLVFNEVSKSLKTKDGKKIEPRQILDEKKDLFKTLTIAKTKNKIKDTFEMTDIKDLINKKDIK